MDDGWVDDGWMDGGWVVDGWVVDGGMDRYTCLSVRLYGVGEDTLDSEP